MTNTHVNKIATDLQQTSNRPPVLDHCCAICGIYGTSRFALKWYSSLPPPVYFVYLNLYTKIYIYKIVTQLFIYMECQIT